MTKTDAHKNLDYLKSLAEQGANTPLLGGRIGLVWTALLVPTLFIHGAAAAGMLNISENSVGMLWMVFGIVGGILSFILSRNLDKKPGSGSIGNKIESLIWPVQALLIFGYAIAAVLAINLNKAPLIIINTIMPFAFALGAVNLILLGRITQQSYLFLAGIVSGLFMLLTMVFITEPSIYFISAIGVFFTGVLPSIIQMRKEPEYVA